jgi:hypothetical protein
MFLISFKFPARSEQVEHCSLSQTLDHASYQSYCSNISFKMAGLAETLSNIDLRSVVRFLGPKGTSPAKIHRQLVEVYGANVMSRKQVGVWCTAFDNSRTDVQDESDLQCSTRHLWWTYLAGWIAAHHEHLPPSSESKSKPSKQQAYSLTPKMEIVPSS